MSLLRGRIVGDGVSNPMLVPIRDFYGWTGPTKFCVFTVRKTGPNLSTSLQYSLDGSVWNTVININTGGAISMANANNSLPFNQRAPHFRINIAGPVTTDYIMHWVVR